ncbi:MAG TPA: hypothetical protein IGS37_09560 [Synechococcales cyanobacterium M55_K2018_004]|nr:hypothetical protein [Synechococcales cyanobacterium M55_K2018_004]
MFWVFAPEQTGAIALSVGIFLGKRGLPSYGPERGQCSALTTFWLEFTLK